ncbi:hypothetical protein Pmani_024310 [Petrolisthes manimaculis]|uniref:Uncharacterized protein n=1 Tax=Petrolisthes manimaculis TaxID=1843537 RepID=A0AAE1PAD4_9EUCA|nr:hypothetical protein Pmani_024310 [Petrolisthes manimaculis]
MLLKSLESSEDYYWCHVGGMGVLEECHVGGVGVLVGCDLLHISAGLHCQSWHTRDMMGSVSGEGVGESGPMRQYTLPVLLAWVVQQCADMCTGAGLHSPEDGTMPL